MEHIGQSVERVMSELVNPKKKIFPSMTKLAIQKRCSWMLKNYPGGTILEGTDKKLLLALIDNHPDKAEKIGCGIEEIVVMDDGRLPTEQKAKDFLFKGTVAALFAHWDG